MFLHGPEEAEEGDWDEDGADVGEGEAVFGDRFAFVTFAESLVDAIDLGHEEPDRGQETETGAEVEETDLFGVEAVVAFEDRLHVCVDAVCCSENQGLVCTHDEHDRLSDDLERSLQRMDQFVLQRAIVFAFIAVFARGTFFGFHVCDFAAEKDGGVGFMEEEVADNGVNGTDYRCGPEDPAPACSLDYDASEKRTQGRPQKRSE